MGFYDLAAVLVTLAAFFSYVNYRYIRLPTTIGLMALSLALSIVLLLLGKAGLLAPDEHVGQLLSQLDFYDTLMHGMLSFLLFAGALHVNFSDLMARKWIISLLATVGVLVSTLLVGGMTWLTLHLLGLQLPLIYCFLFGALISPTDPIAVLGIMKKVGAPKDLETTIAGESLFNDGMGVVVFLALLGLLHDGGTPDFKEIGIMLAVEAGGGLLFGAGIGYICYQMLKRVDKYQVEVLLTLATVVGGYRLAEILHISAPLAIVAAGLLVGNQGRYFGMSPLTRRHLDSFWELVDEILNAVLFVLIGLEVLILPHDMRYISATLILIPVVLLARFLSVGSAVTVLRARTRFQAGTIRILTWAGLRGGISVALALSLPLGSERNALVTITYGIMAFSILVQGLSVGRMVGKFMGELSDEQQNTLDDSSGKPPVHH